MRGKIGTAKDFAGLHKRIAILVTVGVVAAAGILVFLFVFWRGKSSKSEVNYREYTVSQGAVTVGLTGLSGGELADLCELCIRVPSEVTARIQEAHILIGHIVCEEIDEAYGNGNEDF